MKIGVAALIMAAMLGVQCVMAFGQKELKPMAVVMPPIPNMEHLVYEQTVAGEKVATLDVVNVVEPKEKLVTSYMGLVIYAYGAPNKLPSNYHEFQQTAQVRDGLTIRYTSRLVSFAKERKLTGPWGEHLTVNPQRGAVSDQITKWDGYQEQKSVVKMKTQIGVPVATENLTFLAARFFDLKSNGVIAFIDSAQFSQPIYLRAHVAGHENIQTAGRDWVTGAVYGNIGIGTQL